MTASHASASGEAITAPKKRRHASPATIVTTSWSVCENEVPEELPEAEPSLSVSELSLYLVVTIVHIILSLSCNQMFQSSAIQHLRNTLHLPGLGDMIHCQQARNPKLPMPATILRLQAVICSVATLALWVVHITM